MSEYSQAALIERLLLEADYSLGAARATHKQRESLTTDGLDGAQHAGQLGFFVSRIAQNVERVKRLRDDAFTAATHGQLLPLADVVKARSLLRSIKEAHAHLNTFDAEYVRVRASRRAEEHLRHRPIS